MIGCPVCASTDKEKTAASDWYAVLRIYAITHKDDLCAKHADMLSHYETLVRLIYQRIKRRGK